MVFRKIVRPLKNKILSTVYNRKNPTLEILSISLVAVRNCNHDLTQCVCTNFSHACLCSSWQCKFSVWELTMKEFFCKRRGEKKVWICCNVITFLGSKCKRHFRWNKNEHIQPQWTRYSELYFKSSAMSQHIVKTELLDWKGRDSRGKGSNIRIQRSTSNINDRFHHVLQKKNKK